MKKFFLYIFIIFISFHSTLVFSQKLESININGLDRLSRGTFLNYLPIESGDELNQEILDQSLKVLFNTDLFSKLSADFKDGVLTYDVSENPIIKYLDFKNYKDDLVLNNEVIIELRKNFKLNDGEIFSNKNLDKLLNNLKKLYQDNAFYKSKITVKTDLDSQNRIGIELDFDEGSKALIKKFNVSGNSYFSSDEILDLFDIGEPDLFIINYFTEKDNFSRLAYDAGLEKVVNLYTNAGFLDINLSNSKVSLNESENSVSIDIVLVEGVQYKVGKINFAGDLLQYSEKYLSSFIPLVEEDIFERTKVITGINEITDLYRNNGYAFAEVKLRALPSNLSTDHLELIIDIDTKKLFYINRIEISGNQRTQDDVIRREMQILEGQKYSKEELIESVKRIKRLGYFSSVEYNLKQVLDSPDKVNLYFELIETKTGEFAVGVSHSNATGASLNLSISQNNILGTGNTLKAALRNSDAVEELSFYFLDPHFNNDGHTVSYGFFDKTLDASNLDASAYSISESGINFGYGIPIFSDSDLFGEVKISSLKLSCGTNLSTRDEITQCANPDNNDITSSIKYSHNSLNDYLFPTSGTKQTISLLASVPFSDLKYYKIEGSYSNYRSIFDNKTLKLANRIKYATGYGGDNLPFYKRYFEGGTSSVRGFDFNSLGAKYPDGKPKGGEFSMVSTIGLSSSMDSVGIDNPNMKFITFADAGMISEKATDFSLSDFRSSAGLGINWLTPVGPLGFHFAYPLLKKSEDLTKTFSFELGTTF